MLAADNVSASTMMVMIKATMGTRHMMISACDGLPQRLVSCMTLPWKVFVLQQSLCSKSIASYYSCNLPIELPTDELLLPAQQKRHCPMVFPAKPSCCLVLEEWRLNTAVSFPL